MELDVTIFSLPFMQRALVGGILISLMLSFVGVFVTLRRTAFYGDAIAHSSLTGVAFGMLLGIHPFLAATMYAMGISLLIPRIASSARIPIDTLLGILLPVSMAGGVLLLSLIPGYKPELMSYLFGSILGISWNEIGLAVIMTVIIGVLYGTRFLEIVHVSFDPEYARIRGIRTKLIDGIFFVSLACVVVLGINLVGIILLNAMLILPAATARLVARSLRNLFSLALLLGVVATSVGIIASYYLNLPTGPAIALVGGLIFVLTYSIRAISGSR